MSVTAALLPPSIRDDRAAALAALVDRLDTLDLTRLLTHRIREVDASALPHFAWGWHVLGEGWDAAAGEAEQRALIAAALEIHRYKGTPYAVRRALGALGYAGSAIEEGLPVLRHDRTLRRDGTERYHAGQRWAMFRVVLDLGNEKGFAAGDLARVAPAIAAAKNARSHLAAIGLRATLSTTAAAAVDDTTLMVRPDGLSYRRVRDGARPRAAVVEVRRDGALRFDGTIRVRRRGWSGITFGAGRLVHRLGLGLAVADRRRPHLPRDGSLRYDARYDRTHAGAIDPAASMRPVALASGRGTAVALDLVLSLTARLAPPRDGTTSRDGTRRYGTLTMEVGA